MAAIDLKKATIKIKDGSVSPNVLTVKVGEGNLTFSEKKNMEYVLDRGILDTVKEGDQVPVEVNFDLMWEYIMGSSSTAPGVFEALRGTAVGWVSTDSDACRPFACDIEVEYTPTPWNCGDKEVITFPDFRVESLDGDLRAATISASGKCNVTTIFAVRTAQTS